MKKLTEDENLQKKAAEALKGIPANASEADQLDRKSRCPGRHRLSDEE